jgi:hypothetical protein
MWMMSKKTTTHLICDGLAAGKTNRMLNSGHRAKNQVHPPLPQILQRAVGFGSWSH